MIDVVITSQPLDASACIAKVFSPASGGINVFIGTVRNETAGKKVIRLEFEAYEKMALSEMEKIAREAMEKWPVHKFLIHHRTGIMGVGEIPVIIAVSAAHRDAAFNACRYAIDTLKLTVPIWKKEFFDGGEVWVEAHP